MCQKTFHFLIVTFALAMTATSSYSLCLQKNIFDLQDFLPYSSPQICGDFIYILALDDDGDTVLIQAESDGATSALRLPLSEEKAFACNGDGFVISEIDDGTAVLVAYNHDLEEQWVFAHEKGKRALVEDVTISKNIVALRIFVNRIAEEDYADVPGEVIALNQLNGEQKWTQTLDDHARYGLSSHEGVLFLSEENRGHLVARSIESGELMWSFENGANESLFAPKYDAASKTLITAFGNSGMVRDPAAILGLNINNGRLKWQIDEKSFLEESSLRVNEGSLTYLQCAFGICSLKHLDISEEESAGDILLKVEESKFLHKINNHFVLSLLVPSEIFGSEKVPVVSVFSQNGTRISTLEFSGEGMVLFSDDLFHGQVAYTTNQEFGLISLADAPIESAD